MLPKIAVFVLLLIHSVAAQPPRHHHRPGGGHRARQGWGRPPPPHPWQQQGLPPPPWFQQQNGGNQNGNFVVGGQPGGQQPGGFWPPPPSGGGGPGGPGFGGQGRPDRTPITVPRNGTGICNTQLPRQQAGAWDKVGKDNEYELMRRALELLNSNRCIRPPGPHESGGFGQCPRRGVGKCDTATTRTESIYIEVADQQNGVRYVLTNGIPDHCYQVNQDRANPNEACEHYRIMSIPINPQYTGRFIEHRMGPVGVATSGAFFYNHKSAEPDCNVAALQEQPTFDPCDGHADPTCSYHYHKAPVCIKGWDQCKFMGWMNDGVPVYGQCFVRINGQTVQLKSGYVKKNGQNGCDTSHYEFNPTVSGGNLDRANGFRFQQTAQVVNAGAGSPTSFNAGTYAYFFTPEYPFIMAGTMTSGVQRMCAFTPSDL